MGSPVPREPAPRTGPVSVMYTLLVRWKLAVLGVK